MSFWSRRPSVPPLPPQVRAGLALPRGERLLAHALLADGGWAIATTAALVLVGPVEGPEAGPGTPTARRWWHDVAEARFDPDLLQIAVDWADGADRLLLTLTEPVGPLPEVLRERVTSTSVLSERVPVQGRRGVTVAVRRHAVDGSLFTQVVPDRGVQATGGAVADQIRAVTRDLAEQAGLPG